MTTPGQTSHDPPAASSPLASKAVKLGTVTALSALVVGFCAAQNSAKEVTADCVELTDVDAAGRYRVVDEWYCDDDDDGSHYTATRGAYRWYYGGRLVGDRVSGGTTIRPSDATITTRTGRTIQRGGFGGRGFGGG